MELAWQCVLCVAHSMCSSLCYTYSGVACAVVMGGGGGGAVVLHLHVLLWGDVTVVRCMLLRYACCNGCVMRLH